MKLDNDEETLLEDLELYLLKSLLETNSMTLPDLHQIINYVDCDCEFVVMAGELLS